MTVPSNDVYHDWAGNGSTTTFAIPATIKFTASSQLYIDYRNAAGTVVDWTEGTQYTVVGTDIVVETSPTDYTPEASSTLYLERIVDITQETDYTDNDPFPATTHETALDKLTMICQQLEAGVSGTNPLTVRFASTVNDSPSLELSELAAARQNKVFIFDATGATLGLAVLPTSGIVLLDEDDMISDSDQQGCTQQSIKAYADNLKPDTATLADVATKVGVLNVKVIDIGDWDMSTATGSDFVAVPHGIADWTKIRPPTTALIIKDDGSVSYSLDNANLGGSSGTSGVSVDSTNVTLFRMIGGYFDGVNFDSTSFNRGRITIWYID